MPPQKIQVVKMKKSDFFRKKEQFFQNFPLKPVIFARRRKGSGSKFKAIEKSPPFCFSERKTVFPVKSRRLKIGGKKRNSRTFFAPGTLAGNIKQLPSEPGTPE